VLQPRAVTYGYGTPASACQRRHVTCPAASPPAMRTGQCRCVSACRVPTISIISIGVCRLQTRVVREATRRDATRGPRRCMRSAGHVVHTAPVQTSRSTTTIFVRSLLKGEMCIERISGVYCAVPKYGVPVQSEEHNAIADAAR
jgi:hypothetical protein